MGRIGAHHDIHQSLVTSDRYDLCLTTAGSGNGEVDVMLASLHDVHVQLGSVADSHLVVQAALFADRHLQLSSGADPHFNNHARGDAEKNKCKRYSHLFLQRRMGENEE